MTLRGNHWQNKLTNEERQSITWDGCYIQLAIGNDHHMCIYTQCAKVKTFFHNLHIKGW